jgi:hypothetical protein
VSRDRFNIWLARTALVMAVVVAPAGAAGPLERYDRLGISFEYPSSWFVTSEPLSDGSDPDYRFAVSTTPVRRTRHDRGPCLSGIARQLPRGAALVFLREYRGASRRRALPRLDPMPRRISLTRYGVPCGFHGAGVPHAPFGRGDSVQFREARRALILFVWVGPNATKATERQLRRLIASLEIRPR